MEDDEFCKMLKKAVEGDKDAIYRIIKEYEGIIIKNSIINGKFDEDCKAAIEAKLIENIRKFKKIL